MSPLFLSTHLLLFYPISYTLSSFDSMAPKKKIEKLDAITAKKVILEYMEKEYRPFSVTDLVLNLHSQINKVLMVKLLDELVEEQRMIVKRYGKLSFYCLAELKLDVGIEPVTLEMIKALNMEIEDIESDYNDYRKKISQLNSELTDAALIEKVKDLLASHDEYKKILAQKNQERAGDDHPNIEQAMAQVTRKEQTALKKYKKMKKIYSGVLNTMKESVPNFEAQLEDLGIEPIPAIGM